VIARIRRAAWEAGTPARAALIASIRLYRALLSASLGGQCRFYPSCSQYAEEAVRVHGALKGSLMAAWRIARCGPFTAGGVDRVPAQRAWKYDVDARERARA
jgi:putative membrane protein insertion efficiency factor